MKLKKDIKKYKGIFNKYFDKANVEYERVYVRPSRLKSLITFVFNVVLLIVLIRIGFKIQPIYLCIFIVNFAILIFNGINVFTKDGIRIPKYVEIKKEDDDRYQV